MVSISLSRTFVLLFLCFIPSITGENAVSANDETGDQSQFRQYTCIERDPTDISDCRLTFMTADDEPATITDSGCFIEKDMTNHELRNFCPLQCGNADFAYVIAKRPDTGICIEDKTFGISRRRHDWFLWRAGECLTEEMQYDFGCISSKFSDSSK